MTEPMGERGRQGAAPLGGHTPGPWSTWGPDHKAGEEAWHINGPGHGTVGFTYSRANARLIAAAPDLLNALGSMVAVHFEAHGPHPVANCKAVPCQKATKALDAAEGPDSW